MNLASLEALRKEKCTCGCQYVWFRHHEVDCGFFIVMNKKEEAILKERRY